MSVSFIFLCEHIDLAWFESAQSEKQMKLVAGD